MNGLAALAARGREVRSQRRDFGDEVIASEDPIAVLTHVLEGGQIPDFLSGMAAVAFIKFAPGIGRERSDRLAERAGVSKTITLGRLSARQCAVLAHELRKR